MVRFVVGVRIRTNTSLNPNPKVQDNSAGLF